MCSSDLTEATEERNRILADLRSQVAAISIAAANKLVGESLDEKRQHQLISDFFSRVPARRAMMPWPGVMRAVQTGAASTSSKIAK